MSNAVKWGALLACGAFFGVLTVITDTTHAHTATEYVRNILLTEAPTVTGLMTTLKKQLGQ